ncbi:type 1 glutamine amidotransferase [Mycobacterium sp. AZCC_0083]|uniref:type 1 glutamine amidotransferase n=1 Tax=Mycobacterium sp. AZCC_0083 TaxID=2735882 RepID=UPI00160D54D8|nr:type 1 glutamine amidotransferase [Mycobacterium sp. AZCC_0083]MBB5167535.1 GMP synthase-like glutamine amidotransferase [Mycobacterium sp. AZCC_0083]
MTKPVLVFQHADVEPPGAYLPALASLGSVQTVRAGIDPFPTGTDYSAVVSMGGPMGVGDRHRILWLDEEIDYIRAAVHASVPVWGVCLGAQILAAALGATVYTGAAPEVGIQHVELTEAGQVDPVWSASPSASKLEVLQWHSDTYTLPEGAALLASSPAYPNQLFRYGRCYGVQFHIEATSALAKDWLTLEEYRASLAIAAGPAAEEEFLHELALSEHRLTGLAAVVMRRWIEDVVAPPCTPRA